MEAVLWSCVTSRPFLSMKLSAGRTTAWACKAQRWWARIGWMQQWHPDVCAAGKLRGGSCFRAVKAKPVAAARVSRRGMHARKRSRPGPHDAATAEQIWASELERPAHQHGGQVRPGPLWLRIQPERRGSERQGPGPAGRCACTCSNKSGKKKKEDTVTWPTACLNLLYATISWHIGRMGPIKLGQTRRCTVPCWRLVQFTDRSICGRRAREDPCTHRPGRWTAS